MLIVPIDLFLDVPSGSGRERSSVFGTFPLDRPVADPAAVSAAANLLAMARAPIIIAGGGVHVSDAADALAVLQDRAALPVATTTMGKGAVDEEHPLSIGVIGYFMGPRGRTRYLRDLVEQADVVFLIGNRTNQNGTDSWSLYPRGAKLIHLDIDAAEIGRNYDATIRLVGDARQTLLALLTELEARDLQSRHSDRPALEARIADGHRKHVEEAASTLDLDQSPVRPERLLRDLDDLLTSDTLVVADASYSSVWIANYLTSRKPGTRFLTPRGLAGLGWGLPYAIGAKAARADAVVVCVVGDGGFAHVWSELETSRRMALPVIVIVLNNQILGYEKHAEKVLFNAYSDACDFTPVDHAAIARACGCDGIRIEAACDFKPALQAALATGRTTVLDVITDEHAFPPVTMFEGNTRLAY